MADHPAKNSQASLQDDAKPQPQRAGESQATGSNSGEPHRRSHAVQRKRAIVATLCLAGFVAVSLFGVNLICNSFDNGSVSSATQHGNQDRSKLSDTEPFYVLLIGSDSRKGTALYTGRSSEHAQVDQHSDIMTLVRVDPVEYKITLVTIPRDTKMPGGDGKINDALLDNDPDKVVSAVENLLNVSISGYLMTDFASFPKFIDELGGLTLDVPKAITVSNPATGEDIKVKAGKNQTLNGDQVLALARARKQYDTSQDAYRQVNVRNIEKAIINKVLAMDSTDSIRATIGYLRESCSSDIDYNSLAPIVMGFVENRDRITLYSCTGPYKGANRESDGLWVCYEDTDAWAKVMQAVDAGEDPSTVVEAPEF